MKTIVFLSACALLMTACSGSGTSGELAAAQGGSASGGQGGSDSGVADQWVTLLQGHWELAAGEETYQCVRKTLDQDFYIRGFRDLPPGGTHHTVLVVGNPQGPDGIA